MLTKWQEKFPEVFGRYPKVFTDLSPAEQVALSEVFGCIEVAGHELLNDDIVDKVLNNSYYINELSYLVRIMKDLNCLNQLMCSSLFEHRYLPELKEQIGILSLRGLVSFETITFLLTSPNTEACIGFMLRAIEAEVDIASILTFLRQDVAFDGLSRTLTLFDISNRFNYKQENFKQFALLSKILENPLCQTIFDARLRGFSDYSVSHERLSAVHADTLIHAMTSCEDSCIEYFFNYFVDSKLRPFPPSQKDMVDVDIAFLVHIATSSLDEITQDSDVIFNKIKYKVASLIEDQDLYSERRYGDLMNEIKAELNRPPVYSDNDSNTDSDSDTDSDEFERSRGRKYPRLNFNFFGYGSVSSDSNDTDSDNGLNP